MANIFSFQKQILDRLKPNSAVKKKEAAEPRYIKCTDCLVDHSHDLLEKSRFLCPRCGCHLRLPARSRLAMILDVGTQRDKFTQVGSGDPIGFPGYREKLKQAVRTTGIEEACVCATGKIGGVKVMCAALDSSFFMGSMGTGVGERITLCAEYAHANKLPLIIFSASGGARMQEGIFSLMQMAKTSAAVQRFSDAGGLYISCITHPTTGGVTASFASLGDVMLAEPGALFGFAGPRVIEQTIRETLPEGFQRSEFQQEHGFVDAVVPRNQLRDTLVSLLALHRR